MLKQSFSQHLKVNVDAQRQVLAGYGGTVQLSVHVVSLDAPVSVTKQNLHPLLSTQILFIGFLDALLAYIVSANIIVIVLNVFLGHFADVSQQMAGRVIGILTDSTPLNIETWKFEQLLLKHTALFGRKLRHEHLMGVFGITGVHPAVLDVLHPFVKLLTGNVQGTAKVECIQLRHLPRHKRNIIGRLVKHEQLTVTVVDSPP